MPNKKPLGSGDGPQDNATVATARSSAPSLQARSPTEGLARIARIVVQGPPPESLLKSQAVLLQCFEENWPKGLRARFTMTMGGFLQTRFATSWSGGTGWDSRADDFAALIAAAQPSVTALLSQRVVRAAARCTQYLTLGIDLVWEDGLHGELVAIVDVAAGTVAHWTGKSFPSAAQSYRLIQVAGLQSHCFDGADERVLILCGHDLSIYNPRARKSLDAESLRGRRCQELDAMLARYQPTMVLQHPHNMDSPQLFSQEWKQLLKQVPSVSCWASGIAYCSRDEGEAPLCSLDEVLQGAHSARDVVDVIATAQPVRSSVPERHDGKQPGR